MQRGREFSCLRLAFVSTQKPSWLSAGQIQATKGFYSFLGDFWRLYWTVSPTRFCQAHKHRSRHNWAVEVKSLDALVAYSKNVSPLTVQIVLILQDPNTGSTFSEVLSEILSLPFVCYFFVKDTVLIKKQNQGPQLIKKRGVTEECTQIKHSSVISHKTRTLFSPNCKLPPSRWACIMQEKQPTVPFHGVSIYRNGLHLYTLSLIEIPFFSIGIGCNSQLSANRSYTITKLHLENLENNSFWVFSC